MTRPLTDVDVHLFNEGRHRRLHECLGAQVRDDTTWFTVWAPGAREVRVTGDFDGWGQGDHRLEPVGSSGLWTAEVPGAGPGDRYLYRVMGADGAVTERADPVAAASTEPPEIASRIAQLDYEWGDAEWMHGRGDRIAHDAPVSIYEVHLGSWGRHLAEGRRFANYRDMGDPLADHALAHGFTHVELLPIMEHPFYGSWGYQTLGYFAPTARYGDPGDLMAMIDRLHQREVGVILDWVPSHFPTDRHGLAVFDGTHLYEHADPRQGFHPDWSSAIFNYGRHEVRSFLLSSAISWLDRYHADGLRIDAVASMLYLDYSRREGEWIPNVFGGRENLEAITFLRELNEVVYEEFPDVATFAEESTAWPMVSRPTEIGGLGFGYKWDMGWMHDTLAYVERDPIHRRWHHDELTFRAIYAFTENYTLPLSHDEVVHGKGSLLGKMPGDDWQQFANLRLLYGYQWTQPGKKLLFMGGELAPRNEWHHDDTLDWSLHDVPAHAGVRRWLADLNRLYRDEPALHAGDCDPAGFSWVVGDDAEHSVFVYLRHDPRGEHRPVLVVVNATPAVHHNYRVGVPSEGPWREIANSDDVAYGGSGVVTSEPLETHPVDSHGQHQSILLTVPPLAVAILAPDAP